MTNKITMLQSLSQLWKIVNQSIQLSLLTSQLLAEFIDNLSDLWNFLKSHANLLEFIRTMTTRMTSTSDDDNVWVALTAFPRIFRPDGTASRIPHLEDLISVDKKLLSVGFHR